MIYALQAEVEFSNKANRDTMSQLLKDKIASRILWADAKNPLTIDSIESESGRHGVSVILRFKSKAARDDAAQFLKDKIAQIPAFSGTVKRHICYHDQVGSNRACESENEIEGMI